MSLAFVLIQSQICFTTDGQSVFLLVRTQSGARRHLRFYSCGAPSLTRGRVCNLSVQLLLGLASAVTLRSEFRGTRGHIIPSHLGLGFLSVASYGSKSCGGGILSNLHAGGLADRRRLYRTHVSGLNIYRHGQHRRQRSFVSFQLPLRSEFRKRNSSVVFRCNVAYFAAVA
jgi:hypothetical protein